MRKITLLIIVALMATTLFAQGPTKFKPVKIAKAVAFDKTIPLRDMRVILPGERDRSWKDGLIQNKFVAPPQHDVDIQTDPVLQDKNGQRSTRGIAVNVAGTSLFGGAPPDTDGDVGPNHYMQMVNLSLAVYDKAGNKIYGPVDNSTLWDGFDGPWSGHNDGDPIIMYDEKADRWIASQFAVDAGAYDYELVAVSVTGDPTGEWYRYAFEYDNFNDYPKLGVWEDAYYCTYNMFSGSFIGAGIAAFDREAMLAGDPDAEQVFFQLTSNTYGMLPSDCDGPNWAPTGAPHYLAHLKRGGSQRLQIYECDIDWDTPANSTLDLVQEVVPESYASNISGIPQPGTTVELDDFVGQLLYRLQYRNFETYEMLLMNHIVNAGGHAGIRWYELRKNTGDTEWSVYQQGTYAPDDTHRWMSSICMDNEGNIALGYTASNDTDVYPSIRYTGRTPDAPLGEMSIEEVVIYEGSSAQTWTTRWGDYACINHDPSQPGVFWHTNEYMGNSGSWKTRIAAFDFDEPQLPEVTAGEDGSICSNEAYTTQGSATYAASVEWTTSGDGTFVPFSNAVEVNYIRGSEDIINGMATLTLTATGYGTIGSVSDDVVLYINSEPNANAGNDTVACLEEVLQLNSTADFSSSVMWFTNGDGSFNNTSVVAPIYTPGANDYANGVTLTMSAQPMEGCSSSDSDAVSVTFQDCTGIEDIAANATFEVTPNPTNGPFEIIVKGVTTKDAKVSITTVKGKTIFDEMIYTYQGSYSKAFDFKQFPAGIYIVSLTSGKNIVSKKLVLNK